MNGSSLKTSIASILSSVAIGVSNTGASEANASPGGWINLSALTSPVVFSGDANTAYRDPTAVYHDGVFHLYFTLVKSEPGGKPCSYTAWSKSTNLIHWTEPCIFTPRDRALNFSSPGNVIRFRDEWVLCLQTYPRPQAEKYANADARVWIRRSRDLENWNEPELLRVKGPDVPTNEMGRMIDPYLLADKDNLGKWWCFFKQNGASMSWSRDLTNWTFSGRVEAGENVCVLIVADEYVMFHSPKNGIGMKRARDLQQWRDEGLLTLGQADWPWAQGRLTAGFVLDLKSDPRVGKYLMFFHGSGPEDERTMFDNFASLGIAWSDDLKEWHWPGQANVPKR
jgi:hypothetical protein